MRLLIADTIFPKGHCCLNKHLLEILLRNEKIAEVKLIDYQDYYANHSNKVTSYNVSFLLKVKCLSKLYLSILKLDINSISVFKNTL